MAQKKLNADQKAQVLKKPGLQAQLAQLEEQLSSFRAFAHELEDKAAKERSSLNEAYEAEIAKAKLEATRDAEDGKLKAVEDGLRVVIQFLHTAASKRQVEEAESDEARAFEGALLLVYQGNETALSTLKNLVYGTEDKVNDVHGEPLDFTFGQVKESSMQSAQEILQNTEPEAEDEVVVQEESAAAATKVATDQTIANAGLTEIEDTLAIQATSDAAETAQPEIPSAPEQASTDDQAANAVGEAWDPQASMVTDTSAANEDWVNVSRDPAEADNEVAASPAAVKESGTWAEEAGAVAAAAAAATTKVNEKPAATENDGFEQVRRERGRGRGAGRGGRGEFRGRGRGGRDGHRGGGGRGSRDGQGGPRGGRGSAGPRGENKS